METWPITGLRALQRPEVHLGVMTREAEREEGSHLRHTWLPVPSVPQKEGTDKQQQSYMNFAGILCCNIV